MFFFVSGEGQLLNASQERHFAVPTVEQRGNSNTGAQGTQGCLGRILPATGLCDQPLSRGFPTTAGGDAIFSLFPFANDPTGIYGRNTYTQALSADARGAIFSGKYDYNFPLFKQQQTFTARYNFTKDRRDLTDVGGALFSSIRPKVRTDNLSTFLSGGLTDTISNELRFSFGRTRLEFEELRDTTGFLLPASSSQITNPEDRRFLLNAPLLQNLTNPDNVSPGCNGRFALCAPSQVVYRTSPGGTTGNSSLRLIGQLSIAGFSSVGVHVFNFPQQRANRTFQIADTVRWQLGNHALALGTDIRRSILESDLPGVIRRPLVSFNGGIGIARIGATNTFNLLGTFSSPLSLAASGATTGFFQSLIAPGKDASIELGYHQLNFFGQDEWRVFRNFSINYGLRYEYNTTPKEADRKIENTFQQTFPSFLSGLNRYVDGRSKIYESDANNFAARLGFAYEPASSTVIRGGFGMYYDQIIGSVVSQSRNVFPTFATANFAGGVLAANDTLFTLFNPQNAVFDPVSGTVCNPRDITPACVPSQSIPLIQPGTLN